MGAGIHELAILAMETVTAAFFNGVMEAAVVDMQHQFLQRTSGDGGAASDAASDVASDVAGGAGAANVVGGSNSNNHSAASAAADNVDVDVDEAASRFLSLGMGRGAGAAGLGYGYIGLGPAIAGTFVWLCGLLVPSLLDSGGPEAGFVNWIFVVDVVVLMIHATLGEWDCCRMTRVVFAYLP